MIPFKKLKNWIFDMDGTLTMAIHNFDHIRAALALPENCDILAEIENTSDLEVQKLLREKLNTIELQLAYNAEKQDGIIELLTYLKKQGCNLGIITRNNQINTVATLKAAGLSHFFERENILTRECAQPKPSPEPILQLLYQWQGDTEETVMVGDYVHDINAGIAAQTYTLYFDGLQKGEWTHLAHSTINSWQKLLPLIKE